MYISIHNSLHECMKQQTKKSEKQHSLENKKLTVVDTFNARNDIVSLLYAVFVMAFIQIALY